MGRLGISLLWAGIFGLVACSLFAPTLWGFAWAALAIVGAAIAIFANAIR